MKTVSAKDLGFNLPVPVKLTNLNISLPGTSFAFRPWRMAEEKKAGELKAKYKHPCEFLRELLDAMLTEFGGVDWTKADPAKKPLVMAMLPYSDVFYLYICLRIDALGPEFKFAPVDCPQCSFHLEGYQADLGEIEVMAIEANDPAVLDYRLRKPFKMGDLDIETLVFERTPWDAMAQIPAADMTNGGLIKAEFLRRSLVGAKAKDVKEKVDGLDPGQLLASMTKVDIEGAHKALSEFNGGPTLARTLECPKCSYKWGAALDWTYEHFFGTTSL